MASGLAFYDTVSLWLAPPFFFFFYDVCPWRQVRKKKPSPFSFWSSNDTPLQTKKPFLGRTQERHMPKRKDTADVATASASSKKAKPAPSHAKSKADKGVPKMSKKQLMPPFLNPDTAPIVRPKLQEHLWGTNVACEEAPEGCVAQVDLLGRITTTTAAPDAPTPTIAYIPKNKRAGLTPAQFNAQRCNDYERLVRESKAKCEELRASKRAAKAASRQLVPRSTPKRKTPTATRKPTRKLIEKPSKKQTLHAEARIVDPEDDEEEEEDELANDEDDEDDEAADEEEEDDEPEENEKDAIYLGTAEDDMAPSAGEEDDEDVDDDEVPRDDAEYDANGNYYFGEADDAFFEEPEESNWY